MALKTPKPSKDRTNADKIENKSNSVQVLHFLAEKSVITNWVPSNRPEEKIRQLIRG